VLVSIILPTFNRAHTLGRAIDSVLKQTYTDWELIIIDNHSKDETDQLIVGYHNSKIILLKIHNDGIIAKSRNLGIRQSKGELIAFLDSDDWWTKGKLYESVKEMKFAQADLIYHSLFKVVKEKQIFYPKLKIRKLNVNVFEDLLIGGNCIPNSSVIVKKRELENIGYLCEKPEIRTWEDFDAWIRISKITNNFHKVNKTLGYVWLGGGNEAMGGNNKQNIEQVFSNITEFEKRYHKDIEIYNKADNGPWWNKYQKGRLLYQLKKLDNSLKEFQKLKNNKIPIFILLKTIYMITIIYLNTIIYNAKH
jgi:glycosyltransferase involved in cell wall biosynthesis